MAKHFKRPSSFKYVAPNFTLTKDGCIKVSNFDAVANSFIRSAKYIFEVDNGREATPQDIRAKLRSFIDPNDFPNAFTDEFYGSGIFGKLYLMCNRAAVYKAQSGNFRGRIDVTPKFSLTSDNCIKLSNLNAVAGLLVSVAAFEVEDAGRYEVSPKTVVQQLKSDVKSAKITEDRGLICFSEPVDTCIKNLYLRICRAALAKVK